MENQTKRSYQKWTPEDIHKLTRLWQQEVPKLTLNAVATHLGRKEANVLAKIGQLKLKRVKTA